MDKSDYVSIRSKLKALVTKQGSTGQKIKLQANYFKLETHPDWALYQYRVIASLEGEQTAAKKALLKPHKDF